VENPPAIDHGLPRACRWLTTHPSDTGAGRN